MGVVPAGAPAPAVAAVPSALHVTPSAYDFREVVLTTSATYDFTIWNEGPTDANYTGRTLSGSGDFSIPFDGCALSGPIPSGGSCAFRVRFAPTALGAATGSVTYSFDAGSAMVSLSGNGAPQLTVSPTSHDFGSVVIGFLPGPQSTITLTNGGTTAVTITAPNLADRGAFLLGPDGCAAGTVLAGGASCSTTIQFNPESPGLASGSITFATTAGEYVSTYTGTGVYPFAASVPSIAFGDVPVGTTATATFTLTNIASWSNVVLGPGLLGSAFSATGTCSGGPTLPAGGSCTWTVAFSPSTTGAFTDRLSFGWVAIAYFDGLPLSGAGVAPAPADSIPPATTATLDPAPNAAGWNRGPATVTLTAADNDGGSGVASIAYSGSGAQPVAATTVASASTTLTVSAEGTTILTFAANDNSGNAEAPKNATVRIDSSAPSVTLLRPTQGEALQDTVTLAASASDAVSGVAGVSFTIRAADGGAGTPVGHEGVPASKDGSGNWTLALDTSKLPDGAYTVAAEAVDLAGNASAASAGATIAFSVRNWAVVALLPASQVMNAGRTVPVKFSIRVAASADPAQPFVHNDELTVRIYATAKPGTILQSSTFGTAAADYRIDDAAGLYIVNFKTASTPTAYTVEVLRRGTLIGSFTFQTTK
jgi:hypothetical protein